MTTRVLTSTRLSRKPPFLRPASTPAKMPITPSKSSAIRPSFAVMANRSLSSSLTGMPNWLSPKSPWMTLPMYLPYWTTSGSLRLYFSLKLAT